jgi:hypothetical protein
MAPPPPNLIVPNGKLTNGVSKPPPVVTHNNHAGLLKQIESGEEI